MKRGFSLIELLTVIAIIGILAGIVTVNISSAKNKARDAKRQADLSAVSAALEMYYAKNKSYPATQNDWDWMGIANYLQPYMSNLPTDPQGGAGYGQGYVYCSDGANYAVDTMLERSGTTDISIANPATCPSSDNNFYQTGTYKDGDTFHYRISSK